MKNRTQAGRVALMVAAVTALAVSVSSVAVAAMKDRIVIAAMQEPPTLDSAWGYSAVTGTILRNVHEALVGRDAATNEPIPELAVSWTQVDPTTWHFELRKDVSFHDGSPFNADAAVEGLAWSWSKENNFTLRTFIGPEMHFRAIDDYLLEVKTDEPDPLLLTRLWQSLLPSAKQLREDPEQWKFEPIGTGPYRFEEWNRGNYVELVANDDWWGHNNEDARGGVHFEHARFDFRPEPASRISAVLAGEAQFAERLPPDPCLDGLGEMCVDAPQSDVTYVRLDAMNPVLGDARVRMAMSLAVDRETVGEVLLGGAKPAAMIVGPAATGFNPDLEPHAYDPERARALIEEAKADGVPLETTPLKLLTRSGSFAGNADVLEVLLEAYKQIGLTNITAEVQEPAIFNAMYINPPRPISSDRGVIALHKHTNESFDFQTTVSLFYMCEMNNSTSCNSKVDELNTNSISLTGDERHRAYQEIAAILYEDNNIIPLHILNLYHGVSEDIEWEPRLDMTILLKDMTPRL